MLDSLLSDGTLVVLPSLCTGFDTQRTAVVTPEIEAIVSPPFSDTEDGERYGEFRMSLDAFSEGNELSVAEDPREKPPDTMLARVEPKNAEFWAVRVTDPEANTAGIRAFGAFAEKDTLVVLTWEFRELINPFDEEVDAARNVWRDLFGAESPHFGEDLDAYLTNYIPV